VTHTGEENYIQGFGEETGRKGSLRRPSHRWKDNIKIDIKGIGRASIGLILLGLRTSGRLL
jgi:hypothetical protein